MEIKRVNNETYESISKYLDIMLSIVSTLNDLCFITLDGKKYMLSFTEDKIGIVENNAGNLNPYSISPDEDMLTTIFETEESTYQIIASELKEVIKTNNLSKIKERLSYLPRIDNFPRDIIEYVQVINDGNWLLEYKWDVTERVDLNSKILRTLYQQPDIIELTVLKEWLAFCFKKHYEYHLGLNDNNYYRPLIHIKDFHICSYPTIYDAKEFIKSLKEYGFKEQIPEDLREIVLGTNKEYNKIKTLRDTYKNYLKDNNRQ